MADTGRLEVLHDTATIINTYLHILHNADSRWDYFADARSLSLIPSAFEVIKKAILEAKARDARVRFITEITKENISYTKTFVQSVELRHLDGVKGNFGVSDAEYIAISTTETRSTSLAESKSVGLTIPNAIYSNVIEDVQQQQYIFEILWNKATPAKQRIREIEEGVQPVSTRILEDQDQIINELRRFNNRATKLSICSAFGGMQMTYKYLFDTFLDIVEKYKKGEGEGMRWIINIDKDNLDLVKVFLNSGIQMRHTKNMPPMNFGVSDVQMAATIEKMEYGKISQSFLISTEPFYIEHFNSLFDEIWKNGVDAKVRIKAIEQGVDSEEIEIIQDAVEAQKLLFNLIQTAKEEILVMCSTANAFHRQEHAGTIHLLREAATKKGVKVRILTPEDELILETERKMKIVQELRQPHEKIGIRFIQPHLQTKVSILIVDKKYSLTAELKDDTRQTSIEAIGLATYSNSQSTVLSYVSIFESLWTQTDLYQKLRESEKVKNDFVNIAAHELRTPVQPILGLADILRSKETDGEKAAYLDVIIRNAKRLQRLTEDILDVTRIESKSLDLKKELFNLSEMILGVIADSNNQIAKEHKDNLKLEFSNPEDVFIEADKGKINQVISNLLNNAIKFTRKGTVSIIAIAVPKNNEIVVNISDTGAGIDSEILPRLFTKFAAKSITGTGLGLFISKSIIDSHGGKIWGKNNYPEGKGATFGFSLPLQRM
ncbi:MAG TPA: ATP-binding protein [Candidatus Bathyarchaeia archaeon]|nr:ATP-binding protein [Candidatus Bathyarchaeia archaeon]